MFRAAIVVALFLSAAPAAEPVSRTWTVDGTKREALIVAPASAMDNPALVFDFHGHGGTGKHAARAHALHKHLPDAVVVYPQGLPTATPKVDPDGKRPGWQLNTGTDGDRDLKFFDVMLESVSKEFKTDPKRVFVTGHSNGGAFTYLLWAERGDKLAAVAPVAATGTLRVMTKLKPKPCLHVAGEKDPLVKFAGQKLAMNAVKRVNKTEAAGTPWNKHGTLHPAKGSDGAAFVAAVHPGGHEYPAFAAELIAKFFMEFGGK
jgi:polyhydroxybutyrate depolymerase